MLIGSLFSGIGGLDLGIERATGGRVIWQAERDPFARRVLAKNWPGVRCYGDVRQIDERAERPDIICGGFPCQDISNAGKREGIEGRRSGLWCEFARIIRALQPRFVFVENVAALRRRGLDRVLSDLAACGFNAEWDTLGACCVGAPHRRERLFVLGHSQKRVSNTDGEFLRIERERKRRQRQKSRSAESRGDGDYREVADAYCWRRESVGEQEQAGIEGARGCEPHRRRYYGEQCDGPRALSWEAEPSVGRVANGVPDRMDRLRCLGNAVVPKQAALAWGVLISRVCKEEDV